METKDAVLILRSASRNFPLDLEPELVKAGYPVSSLETFNEFVTSPARRKPLVVIVEIGMLDDIDRAMLLFDWSEHVQPLAPTRYLLLLASKNLSLGDRADRIRAAEIAVLPQPARNLLFKIELQSRLLRSAPKPGAAAVKKSEGFTPTLEEVGVTRKRVLVLRGQGEKDGQWQNAGDSPSGKVRWRWIRKDQQEKKAAAAAFTWQAESKQAPSFDPKAQAWTLTEEGDDLLCLHEGVELFSALKSIDPELAAKTAKTPASEKEPASAAHQGPSEKFSEELASPERERPTAPAPEPLTPGEPAGEKPGALSREDAARASLENMQPRLRARAPQEPSAIVEKRETREPNQALRESAAAPAWNVKDGKGGEAVPAVKAEKERIAETAKNAEQSSAGKTPEPVPSTAPEAPKQAALKTKAAEPETAAPAKTGAPVSSAVPKDAQAAPAREKTVSPKTPPAGEENPRAQAGTRAAAPGKAPLEKNAVPGSAIPSAAAPDENPELAEPLPHAKLDPFRPPSLGDAVPSISPADPESALPPLEKLPSSTTVTSREAARLEAEQHISAARPRVETPGLNDLTRPQANPGKPAEKIAAERRAAPGEKALDSATTAGPAAPEPRVAEKAALIPEELKRLVTRADSSAGAESRTVSSEPAAPESVTSISGQAEELDSRRFLKNRLFHLMTLTELGDKESSWHPAGRYRIYLAAQHRYFGLKDPRTALPLWIYEGELAPEFIDEKRCWKFYDRLPVAIYSLESLPAEVMEQVYRLCGVETGLPPKPNEPAKAEEGKEGKSVVLIPGEAAAPATLDHYASEPRARKGVWAFLSSVWRGIFGK